MLLLLLFLGFFDLNFFDFLFLFYFFLVLVLLRLVLILFLSLGPLFLPLLDFFRSQVNFLFLFLLLAVVVALFFLLFLTFFMDNVGAILKIKPHWQLKIELAGSALMLSTENVEELDINLWTVECPVALVNLVRFSELLQTQLELRFSQIPIFDIPKEFLWPGGEFQLILESED